MPPRLGRAARTDLSPVPHTVAPPGRAYDSCPEGGRGASAPSGDPPRPSWAPLGSLDLALVGGTRVRWDPPEALPARDLAPAALPDCAEASILFSSAATRVSRFRTACAELGSGGGSGCSHDRPSRCCRNSMLARAATGSRFVSQQAAGCTAADTASRAALFTMFTAKESGGMLCVVCSQALCCSAGPCTDPAPGPHL